LSIRQRIQNQKNRSLQIERKRRLGKRQQVAFVLAFQTIEIIIWPSLIFFAIWQGRILFCALILDFDEK